MGQQFAKRGKRTDEMIELMRALWQPGWTEFDGEFYHHPAAGDDPDTAAHPDLQRRSVGHRIAARGATRRLDR